MLNNKKSSPVFLYGCNGKFIFIMFHLFLFYFVSFCFIHLFILSKTFVCFPYSSLEPYAKKTPFTIVGMPVQRTPILEVTDPFHTEYSSIKRSNRILGILGPRPPVSRYSRGRSTQQTLYYPYPLRSREPRRYRIPIQVEYDRENTEHPDT